MRTIILPVESPTNEAITIRETEVHAPWTSAADQHESASECDADRALSNHHRAPSRSCKAIAYPSSGESPKAPDKIAQRCVKAGIQHGKMPGRNEVIGKPGEQ